MVFLIQKGGEQMKPSEMARIGDRLKSFREKINLSQTEFAEKCKINVVQYIRRMWFRNYNI